MSDNTRTQEHKIAATFHENLHALVAQAYARSSDPNVSKVNGVAWRQLGMRLAAIRSSEDAQRLLHFQDRDKL